VGAFFNLGGDSEIRATNSFEGFVSRR